MTRFCDECNAEFNVINEGYVSEYYSAWCGTCWKVESRRRGIYSLGNGGLK
jgi:hypothetical protein